MICPKCGQEASGRYCHNCGAQLLSGEDLDFDYIDVPEDAYPQYQNKAPEQSAPLRAPKAQRARNETKKETRKDVKKKTAVKKDAGGKEKTYKKEKRQERTERDPQSRASRKEENFSKRRSGTVRSEAAGSSGSLAQEAGAAAAKGAAGVIVLCSRILQWISFGLMAVMVFRMAQSFMQHKSELGSLSAMVSDKNYGLALYAGASAVTLLMGAFWCLWILSKKSGGGEFRMKKYDVGRGFVPFLICLAAVLVAGLAGPLVPEAAEGWKGLAEGAAVWLRGVNELRDFLISVCLAGAVCSLIRKLLRV